MSSAVKKAASDTDPLAALKDAISGVSFHDEAECMATLLDAVKPYEAQWNAIHADARRLIERLREEGMGLSVEAFLQEYGLSSKEGVAVMCLAEALLRIPDRDTANQLIESTFSGADWEKHLGNSDSLYVNASSWGLLLTGKMLEFGDEKQGATNLLSRLVNKSSEPVIREALKAAMRLIASQFVLGETVKSALKKAQSFEKKGYRFSYDMLGEGARSAEQAARYFESYQTAIREVGKTRKANDSLYDAPGVSIKLTALHPRYEWAQRERVMAELLPRLKMLILQARDAQISVSIDAEEAARLDLELDVFEALFTDPDFDGYHGIGFVLQTYQKRAFYVIDFLVALSQKTGRKMPIRLVKGAYWDSEIKHAQIEGISHYPVFTVKAHSDVSYLACAQKTLSHIDCFYPQFATHNALTIAAIKALAKGKEYEFQRLYGMGEKLYESVIADAPCRIYAPIGEHRDLLAYLIRRLLENGANSSFIHLLMDKSISLNQVLENPIELTRHHGGHSALPLPDALYNDRKNSAGYDLGSLRATTSLLHQLHLQHATAVIRPADATPTDIEKALNAAKAAYQTWDKTPVEQRAATLERMADLLEERAIAVMSLCIREGGKTIPDAIAELREAVDFCRYYAARARDLFGQRRKLQGPTGESNEYFMHGRGVFCCISPWNFPLAIFLGQVTSALAAGNAVIAKPAEQTPAIAAFAVALLHEAGVPHDAVQLICGDGATVGAALIADERISGVAFTGSTATAKIIQRTLAAREGAIIPFIAETGGQNCMIVDSSALIEQAVDDIVHSAFGSAGQRCSALRVLYVHRDIADNLIALLKGAMAELVVGNPALLATDIGPVIDEEAQSQLQAHIQRMAREAKPIATAPIAAHALADRHYIAPHAFEIESIRQLTHEVFGPVLHIIRFDGAQIDTLIDDINSTLFGLTFGVHSRIPPFYEMLCERVHAGNAYVNRGMTGAVVGVQPFGGEGLSGTGPKAGGPYTLLRYANERAITINTAAIGGNIELLIG